MYANLLDLTHPLVWTTPPLLTPDECRAFIAEVTEGVKYAVRSDIMYRR